jgi:hypothetical protein
MGGWWGERRISSEMRGLWFKAGYGGRIVKREASDVASKYGCSPILRWSILQQSVFRADGAVDGTWPANLHTAPVRDLLC